MIFSLVSNFTCFVVLLFVFTRIANGRNYFQSSFLFVYITLFCFYPIVQNLFLGNKMYHPEAVKGEIKDLVYYYIYSALNISFTLAIMIVFQTRAPFSALFKKGKKDFLNCCQINNSPESVLRSDDSVPTSQYVKFLIFLRKSYGLVFVVGFFVYLFSLGYPLANPVSYISNIIKAGRMAHFSNEGLSLFFLNVSYYMMAAVAAFSYLDYKLNRSKSVLSFVVVFLIVLWMVVAGGRQFLIMYISGYIYGKFEDRSLFKWPFLSIGILFGFLLIIWQVVRHAIFLGSLDYIDLENIVAIFLQGDFSYFYYSSLEAIRHYYDDELIYLGNIYRNIIFLVFPTEWTFGLKQRDLSSLFSVAYDSYTDLRTGNYPPGLIGLFVLNFGWVGWLFVGVPFLLLMKYLDSLPKEMVIKWLSGSVFLFFVLQFSRGTLLGVYQWVMLFILYFVFKIGFILIRNLKHCIFHPASTTSTNS